MHLLNPLPHFLPLTIFLFSFAELGLAAALAPDASTPSLTLTPRSQVYDTGPLPLADTPLPHQTLPSPLPPTQPPHRPRALPDPIVIPVPDTKTHIILLLQSRMPVAAILPFLNDAYNVLMTHIRVAGDGVIPAGHWDLVVNGIGLSTINTNNHQQTYGVLGAAVEGLSRFFYENQEKGAGVYFYIFDGGVEVGQGSLGPV